MKIKIYQIDTARDKNRVKFMGLKELSKYRGRSEIDASLYNEVFSGEVDCKDLEEVYEMFNLEPHPLHRGHSLSMSDVVATDTGAFYCDRVGFERVGFEASKTQKSENLLKVVYVEPNKPAYAAEIEATLKAQQRAVKGRIQLVDNGDGTGIVCNEDAKLLGMKGNRRLGGGKSVIAGPFFVVGLGGKDIRSLTDRETQKYVDRFSMPEEISILSFMTNQLLGIGNTSASIDELYLFLSNLTAIEYIRNAMKRVRKKDSSVILSSQNIEDFLIPGIREYTKPLFSIPTHQFLFNAGQINPKEYMDALQIEPSEFELIKYPERGTCLYRCGNERYLLQVIAPEYKSKLFGQGGGR